MSVLSSRYSLNPSKFSWQITSVKFKWSRIGKTRQSRTAWTGQGLVQQVNQTPAWISTIILSLLQVQSCRNNAIAYQPNSIQILNLSSCCYRNLYYWNSLLQIVTKPFWSLTIGVARPIAPIQQFYVLPPSEWTLSLISEPIALGSHPQTAPLLDRPNFSTAYSPVLQPWCCFWPC